MTKYFIEFQLFLNYFQFLEKSNDKFNSSLLWNWGGVPSLKKIKLLILVLRIGETWAFCLKKLLTDYTDLHRLLIGLGVVPKVQQCQLKIAY
jgi:hypothetical protein